MKTLDEIAIECKTDKSSLVHFYTRHYIKYIEHLRNEPIKLLEIGIQDGYSLKMWKEYFPNAQIYGIDINPCSQFKELRITPIQGSQSDINFLSKVNQLYGDFDIIIDDGSHLNTDMKIGVDYFFPRLNRGGLYVIEDTNVCYRTDEHFNSGAPVLIERIKELVDNVNSRGKSGIADIKKDSTNGEFLAKRQGDMDWWETNIEFLHLYRAITFIKRYD